MLAFGVGTSVLAVSASGGAAHAVADGADYPSYSPDGRRLAIAANGIWVTSPDGGRPRQIVPRFASYLTYASPAWSPDGRRIAYIRIDTVHETSELWIVGSGGARLHGLSLVHRAADPAWSPDGRWIAYAGDGGLSAVSADDTRRRLLASGAISAPAWSPDGRLIAYVLTIGRSASIRLLTVATGEARTLARLRSGGGPLAWSPDGKWLAFAAPVALGGLLDIRALEPAGGGQRLVSHTFSNQVDGLTWRA